MASDFVDKYTIKNILDIVLKIKCPILDLSRFKFKLTKSDCEYLANQLKNSNFEFLNLGYVRILDSGLSIILSSLKYTNIKTIILKTPDGDDLDDSDDNITCDGYYYLDHISELCDALKQSKLVNLELSGFTTNPSSIEKLSEALTLSNINKLNLYDTTFYSEEIEILANCLKDTQIIELNLSKCMDRDGNAPNYLFKILKETKIKKLNVSEWYGMTRSDALKLLSDNLKDTSITHLYLSNDKSNDDFETEYFVEGLKQSKIECLDIGHNFVRPEECLSIGNVIHHFNLVELNMSSTGMTSGGVKFLCENLRKSNIKKLILNENSLKDDGAMLIANSLKHSKVECLCVSSNEITVIGLSVILNAINVSRVINLDISENKIKDDDAKIMVNAIKNINKPMNINMQYCFSNWKTNDSFCEQMLKSNDNKMKIRFLVTSENMLNNLDVSSFINIVGLKYSNIKFLIYYNEIKNDDIDHIRNSIKKVNAIYLSNIKISPDHLLSLINSIKNTHLTQVEFRNCELKNEHARIIADNMRYLSISRLIFGNHNIDYEGIMFIINELKNSGILKLELIGLKYSVEKLEEISNVLKNTKYTVIKKSELHSNYEITKFNKLSFEKAKNLIYCFEKNIKIKYSPDFLEYFQAYDFYNDNCYKELWVDVKNWDKIEKEIKLKINENFFDLIDVYGNKKKTFFDKIPKEMRDMISPFLTVNDIL